MKHKWGNFFGSNEVHQAWGKKKISKPPNWTISTPCPIFLPLTIHFIFSHDHQPLPSTFINHHSQNFSNKNSPWDCLPFELVLTAIKFPENDDKRWDGSSCRVFNQVFHIICQTFSFRAATRISEMTILLLIWILKRVFRKFSWNISHFDSRRFRQFYCLSVIQCNMTWWWTRG